MRRSIPSVTQYATPSLIAAITYGGHPRTEDARWPETGAPELAAYAKWSIRWCGMACLRMILLARDGDAPSLYDLTMGGVEYGAYVETAGGQQGLIYRPFVDYIGREHDLDAEVITELDQPRLVTELDRGRLVIASVHPEIRRPDLEPPGTGGHLVLVTEHRDGSVVFHDPAGHTPASRIAQLPYDVFEGFAAGRGIAIRTDGW